MKFFKNRQSRLWRIARFLLASSKDHAFLDRWSIPLLIHCTPPSLRKPLALRLLSLSPHYWVYQFTDRYSRNDQRIDVLQAEFERNASSRREIFNQLLRRFIKPEMTVVDFGCGPGFLAKEASGYAGRVIGTDVSRGVIACAQQLNAAPNLQYMTNRTNRLCRIDDESVDLVYCFAVFQHLLKDQTEAFLREFLRILKPGGQAVCHMILKEAGEPRAIDPSEGSWVTRRVNLRMVYCTSAEATRLFQRAGYEDVTIHPVSSLADIDDDIGSEQLVTARRPAARAGGLATPNAA
jgi:ubiquinone/menaquinone biosynthesis C-methylase UbiE